MTTTNSSSTYAEPELSEFDTGAGQEQPSPLAEAGQHVGDSVGHLAERATGIGLMQADRGREAAADGVSKVADTIRRVSLDMQTEQPAIANAAETAADQAERIADYLRTTDAREILGSVENAARRQPLLFLGGAFVLGVAASRLFKAASGGSDTTQDKGTPQRRYGNGSRHIAEASGRDWLDSTPAGTGTDARA
jgi:hypothetical protein